MMVSVVLMMIVFRYIVPLPIILCDDTYDVSAC